MAELFQFPKKKVPHSKAGLEQFRKTFEFQQTPEYQNWIGYQQALAEQEMKRWRAERAIRLSSEKRPRTLLKSV